MKNFRDYITLTKPRLNSLAILTTLAGFYMGSSSPLNGALLGFTLLGTTGVAAGCGALNQWFEGDVDAQMTRTKKRPIPSGRLSALKAFWFGLALSALGVGILWWKVNELSAFLGICALVSYIILYTPLKKITSLSTVVGAVPGAIPPLMGWAAAQDQIGPGGWSLFFILFFWQMPHFLAIGWMYREDYARAGFPMLAVLDPKGVTTGLMSVAYSAALLPISLLPAAFHLTGKVYFWSALVLGLGFVVYSFLLARDKTVGRARGLFWYSISYLPALFSIMAANKSPF